MLNHSGMARRIFLLGVLATLCLPLPVRAGVEYTREGMLFAGARGAVAGGMAGVSYTRYSTERTSLEPGSTPPVVHWGCIEVDRSVLDFGCDLLGPDDVVIDRVYSGTRLEFSVRSFYDRSKWLHASVVIETVMPMTDAWRPFEIRRPPAFLGVSFEHLSCTGRYGRMQGSVVSARSGGGTIAYEGPPTNRGIAEILDCSDTSLRAAP
jgi:hypothetical protein